jgi:HPt (histidine-containing phosphotransfer) domain-containing protein
LPELANTPDVLASEAHKLRGAAGHAGAIRAAYFCGIVENAPNSSHPIIDQRAVTDLKESLSLTVNDYKRRLKRQ